MSTVSDDFNRSNSSSLGSTPTGSLTWATGGIGDWSISSNTLAVANVTAGYGTWCVVDTSASDGTVTAKILDASVGAGVVFRCVAYNNRNALIFCAQGSNYKLYSDWDAATLGTSSGVTPTNGDVLSVVFSGTSIDCKVNGTSAITTTSSVNASSTYVGLGVTQSGTAASFDDFSWDAAASAASSPIMRRAHRGLIMR